MLNARSLYNSCFILILLANSVACQEQGVANISDEPVKTGAERMDKYLPLLDGKRVGLLVNHSSLIGGTHLLDSLLRLGVNVSLVMSPEHGFHGLADDGEHIKSEALDLPIPFASLYGKHRKPLREQMDMIDVLVFDIQDVGARFYTYISTMHLAMQACAESGVQMIVLDRPNPNDHYIDGPVLDTAFRSFVGMHPIPVVHALTVGELALMITGEGWLGTHTQPELTVIPCDNYYHGRAYELPMRPSPNLPNQRAILLYPSLCFFEGTVVSVGRGTDHPFQQIGHPDFTAGNHSFTPKPSFGAKNPLLEGMECRGYDFTGLRPDSIYQWKQIRLDWLVEFYRELPGEFFRNDHYLDLLAGSDRLRHQLKAGMSAEEIRSSWKEALDNYRAMRNNYLLYPDRMR